MTTESTVLQVLMTAGERRDCKGEMAAKSAAYAFTCTTANRPLNVIDYVFLSDYRMYVDVM